MGMQPLSSQLRILWGYINPRRRRQFILILVLMVFASLAEMISIGAVLPFLAVLMAPERIFGHPAAGPLIRFLEIDAPSELLLPLTLFFVGAALFAGGVRVLLLWASVRLAFSTGADLSISIYQKTLFQPYAVHVSRNSSTIIAGIVSKVSSVINNVITPVLTLLTSAILLVAILIILLAIDPVISSAAFASFGLVYLLIIKLSNKLKRRNGQRIATESTQVVKALQEGLGGIRDVLLDGSQPTYCRIYRAADLPLRRAQGTNQIVSLSPRYVIEALGMTLIAVVAYRLAGTPSGVADGLPVLGALAIGAQRLLPVMQHAYAAWSSIQGGQAMFQDALELLNQPLPDYAEQSVLEPISFAKAVTLSDLAFRYNDASAWVFENINLEIHKGSRVGVIGATGCGKSTLLDIIMGLLLPTRGSMAVDGKVLDANNCRAWQAHIAHVPQAIFLTDSTIEENIAFGVPKDKIDHARVTEAARQAQIAVDIESWPEQYRTPVGERGVRLSGGQRQRIGIARALYKRADVIVFDEATSALDSDTEQAVMQAIEGLSEDLTVIIIAHRVSTLKNCSEIIELGSGGRVRVGSYRELVATEEQLV